MSYKSHKSQVSSLKSQAPRTTIWNLKLGIWCLGLLLCFSLEGKSASTPATFLDSANSAYAKGNFDKAAAYYEKTLTQGYEATEVYFNLGNAYYKSGKIGLCILNYQRAKKLSPLNEDIDFNLKLALQKTQDKIEPAPQFFLEEWWDALSGIQSEETWSWRSIICFILSLFFLGVFITAGHLLTKQIGFWLTILFFVFSLTSFFIAKKSYHEMKNHDSAVIIATSAEAKNAPSETGSKLFILHEGTVVNTPEIRSTPEGDWVEVQLSPEKVGWVKKSQLEFI